MIEFTNFTLSGTYYTAVFFREAGELTFKAELSMKEDDNCDGTVIVDVPGYTMNEMGKELIKIAALADRMIEASRGVQVDGVQLCDVPQG